MTERVHGAEQGVEESRPEAMAQPASGEPGAVHYVGFRDDRYWNAVRLWGGPRVIHRRWDKRALQDIGPGDVVIFAEGDETREPSHWNTEDLDERLL